MTHFRPHPTKGMRTALAKYTVHSGALLVAALISWCLAAPLNDWPRTQPYIPSLICLPFGIKVISAFFEGWKSIAYLFPAALASLTLLEGYSFFDPSTYFVLLVSYGVAPLIFATLDWVTRSDRRRESYSSGWRKMIAAGFLSSLLGAMMIALFGTFTGQEATAIQQHAARFIAGDLLGFAVLLTTLPSLLNYILSRTTPR